MIANISEKMLQWAMVLPVQMALPKSKYDGILKYEMATQIIGPHYAQQWQQALD